MTKKEFKQSLEEIVPLLCYKDTFLLGIKLLEHKKYIVVYETKERSSLGNIIYSVYYGETKFIEKRHFVYCMQMVRDDMLRQIDNSIKEKPYFMITSHTITSMF